MKSSWVPPGAPVRHSEHDLAFNIIYGFVLFQLNDKDT